MSIKKEITGNLSPVSLSESYRCGECLHLKKHAHPMFKETCANRGIKAVAVAPKCFTPDVSRIADNSDSFVQLASLVANYTHSQKRILIAMLKQKPIAKKRFSRSLSFGTKVFFLGMGADYISNYLSGYVMGMTSSGELIITGSPEQNTRGKSYMAYMTDDDNLMTAAEWKKKRQALRDAGRLYDPKMKTLPKQDDAGEAPTIDNAPKEWRDKKEKQRRKGVRDLVQVFDVSGN